MNWLGRILKVQPGEGRKVLHFSALNALIHGGVAIGVTLTNALFLSEIGVERLPYIYLFTPAIMLVYVPLFTRLVRHWGAQRAFLATLLTLAAGAGWLYIATSGDAAAFVYFAAMFLAIVASIALYTLFWNFTDSFFDIQDGKRLFALFSGGGAAGAVAGGLLVSFVSATGYVEPLFLVWSFLAIATVPLIIQISRRNEQLEDDTDAAGSGTMEKRERRMGSYLPLFAGSAVITLILAAVAEYQYLAIFSANADKAELSSMLGGLYALAGGINLIVNLFLFNRMVLTIGVPSVALVTPVAFLAGFTFLLVQPGIASAVVVFLVVESALESIDANNQNFLFNAFPADLKKQIRTIFEGLGEPIATAVGGAILLLGASRLSPAQLSTLGVTLAAVVLLLVVLLRGGYLRSMVRNLKESWLDLSQPSEDLLVGLSAREVEALRDRAASASNLGDVHAAIRILWLNDRQAAADALLDFLGRADASQLVASRSLLSLILRDKDSEVVRRILYWVTEHRYGLDAEFLEELGYHGLMQSREVAHLFKSDEPAELGAAVVTAWHSWRPEDRLQAMQTLDRLVQGGEPFVEVGVRATGQLGQESLAHFIVPYLHHGNARIQRQAIQALRRTVDENSNRLVPEILKFLEVGEEEDRMAGLEALAKIADTSCVAPLLRASGDFTPHERREAERVLLRIGLKSVPSVVSALRDPRYPYRGRALAARALGKLALPQLTTISDVLIHTEIVRAYRFQHFHQILSTEAEPSPGITVLSHFYADLEFRIVDFILEILTIGGRLPDFELISSSLRSPNHKERGNAIETIEQGTPRSLFRHLLPLIDGRSGSAKATYYRANFAVIESEPDEILEEALDSPFSIESAAAAQGLWERGAVESSALLGNRLNASSPTMLRDTIVSILVRDADAGLNPIERLHCLASSRFFERLPVSELELLSRDAAERHYADGDAIYFADSPADELLVITEGSVEVTGADGVEFRGVGDVLGEEGLFGASGHTADAVARGAAALVLSRDLVLDAIRTYPSIGIEMFRQRLTIQDGAATQT